MAPRPAADRSATRRRWWGLAVIGLGQLMIVLDVTIVGVALPTIQRQLQITTAGRQWVVTAYTLAFGGLLLLGGRLGDHLGRKRAFVLAVSGFAVASAVGGAAVVPGMLTGARAGQGAFAALLAPALLSLLATTFTDPRERRIAFGVFGAVSAGGAALGLILGGVLTEGLGWRSVFYVNVLLAALTLAGGLLTLGSGEGRRVRFDVTGAVLATGGLTLLVYGFGEAAASGWDRTVTRGLLAGGVVLLAVFVVAQARRRDPLLPLRVVTHRGRGGAYVASLALGVGMYGASFFLTFYLQLTRGYTPVQTGLAFLPQVAGVLGGTVLGARLSARVAPRVLVGSGLLIEAAGVAWLTRLGVHSDYATALLPSLLAIGAGLGLTSPVASNLATFDVGPDEAGAAGAAFNASQMVGGSLSTALLNTIAAHATAAYLAGPASGTAAHPAALVHGYTRAMAWAAAILAGAALITVLLINARLRGPAQFTEQRGGSA